ncbi:hypothetical protein B7486_71170, partial [cyanobacterium TDX16]
GNTNVVAGGGLRVGGGGGAVLARTTFHGNDTEGEGAGAWVNGYVTIRESTFSANGSAITTAGGGLATPSGAFVSRSTFSGNVAAEGAAIQAQALDLEAVTASDDDPGPTGEAISTSGDFSSETSIIQPVDGAACDIGGTGTSDGYNRTSDSGCFAPATGDLAGRVALGLLAENGGPTQTRLPSLAAPPGQMTVIDAIPVAATAQCPGNGHDQRQVDRP